MLADVFLGAVVFLAGLLVGLFLSRFLAHAHAARGDTPELQKARRKVSRLLTELRAVQAQEDILMSKISAAIQAANDSADAAIGRVQEDVTALQAKIAELEAIIAEGNATPEDEAALVELKAKLDALDPTKPDTLPEG
jgi:peptidoglycan hydrolase CwlO-like protein